MKVGDLIRVRYRCGDPWYHGIVYKVLGRRPDMAGIWRMWCFERRREHILEPDRDQIEIISEK